MTLEEYLPSSKWLINVSCYTIESLKVCTLEPYLTGLESQLASCVTLGVTYSSLGFSFLLWKMGIIIVSQSVVEE